MKRPESIKIGPVCFAVTDDRAYCDDHNAWGKIKYAPQKIWLDPEQAEDFYAVTLFHEVLHGVFYIAGYVGNDNNEEMVTRLSAPLLGVLRDNPELVAFLTQKET